MKNQKKSLRNIIKVIAILAICWLLMFFTDYNKCLTLHKPIFVIPIETADDGGSGTYQGLGYTVELEMELNIESKSPRIISVTMKMFNKIIAASIT